MIGLWLCFIEEREGRFKERRKEREEEKERRRERKRLKEEEARKRATTMALAGERNREGGR